MTKKKKKDVDSRQEGENLLENMEEYEPCKIIYNVKKIYVFKDAVMQFYENIVQIFIGPAISIIGIILRIYTELNFLGALLIGFGIFYIVFPYIMLLSNLTTVKKQKIEMNLDKKGISIKNLLIENNNLSMLGYEDIHTLDKDSRYLRILPQDKNGTILTPISIPIKHIEYGDLEQFQEKLNCLVEKYKEHRVNTEKNVFNGKVIFSYDVTEEQFKKIYVKEYFRKKIHLFYIAAFAGLAVASLFINIPLAITSMILAIFYVVYPRIGYKLHVKDHTGNIVVKNCMNGYITFEGHNIKLKTKPSRIQIAYDDKYIKYYIPIKKKYFRYIYKESCDEKQLQRFIDLISKD